MQPQQSSRINLVELKAQIVKKIGAQRSKKYFYNLSRFLSQKFSKSEFDKSCSHVLGRENLPLHNQLIRAILKNACQAKTPPPVHDAGPAKSLIQNVKSYPGRSDGHEPTGSLVPNLNPNVAISSNGVLPVTSLRKVRSVIHDRNEDLTPYDYHRPLQHPRAVAEQPENEGEGLVRLTKKPRLLSKFQTEGTIVADGEEEQANHIDIPRSPLLAPLGIPFCSASVGGAHKAPPVASSSDFISYHDSGILYDTETLKKRMEQIAAAQGLGGVSLECASVLNNMVDVYMKKLLGSCFNLAGSRSTRESRKHSVRNEQPQGKLVNGLWPSKHSRVQSSSGPTEVLQEQGRRPLISLLDFKVAMELNPQQLGEDWSLLLEKICMRSFEE